MTKRRILFVEHEPEILAHFSLYLEAMGYELFQTTSFDEARTLVAATRRDPFDLIITNIGRDKPNGVKFCSGLRQNGIAVPILIQSGYGGADSILEALRAGASDYLEKVYTREDLLERVEFLLDMPPLVSRHFAGTTMSNGPRVEDYCEPLVKRALENLEILRPQPGSVPTYKYDDKPEDRPTPFDDKMVSELNEALNGVQALIKAGRPDQEELARVRSVFMTCLHELAKWLAGRGTVITDELIKNTLKVGSAVAVAHAMGLRVDLMHLSAALGVLTTTGH